MKETNQDNLIKENPNTLPFNLFLEQFKQQLHNVFHVRADINKMALKRGMPPFVMREIMSLNPLSVAIPAAYGGRGGIVPENLALLSAAAYESLALSLTFGINSALFLQPVAKYAREEVKPGVFERFLRDRNMGGLMITEPGYGSDALNMKTSYRQEDGKYHIQGTKHWAGLTGWAEFWLLTAREMSASGELKRDIDFFICDVNHPDQQIVVEEVFDNLGLYQIPYGRNRLNVRVPEQNRLVPKSTGVKMMLDLLHRSRLQFPGMAMGFIQRLLDESIAHAQQRPIGGKPLIGYDQVQHRLAKLQSSYTICSAMCHYSSRHAGLENDLSSSGFEANSIKSVITDLMQDSAQSATQLVGAQAYKLDHIAGRSITDSRPFQIFEGSNDILYAQIGEALVKMMKKEREGNLYQFLNRYPITKNPADRLRKVLDFELSVNLSQRKLVELGQAAGNIVTMGMVMDLADSGFRKDLTENALNIQEREISSLMKGFMLHNHSMVVDDYAEGSFWMNFL